MTAVIAIDEDASRSSPSRIFDRDRTTTHATTAVTMVTNVADPTATRRVFTTTRQNRESANRTLRSEEHTSELQSLMRISYAVFCLKKKNKKYQHTSVQQTHTHHPHTPP